MVHTLSKKAIQVIPLLIGLGITAGIGTVIGGIVSSVSYYNQLSADPLTSVILPNWRGLDLLTAENSGLCLFLNEECCFYVNQSGIVRDMAQQLQDQVTHRRQELENSWNRWSSIWNWSSWLLPLYSLLFMLLLVIVFGPLILKAITHFISSQMEAIKLQLLVTQYRPLGQEEPNGIPEI
jgi:hypothetical protein